MNEITYEEALKINNPVFIDVRSPVEFEEDHIPDAINIPLFDDKERSDIGTVYRQIGQNEAMIKGAEIAGLKIGDVVATLIEFKDSLLVINCFRGGMRSTTVVSLLSSLGFNVAKLKDGYKGYRKYILKRINEIEIKPKMFVLQGFTGTGKTEILRRIKNSIDLEDMAGHRSSVFGGIGLDSKTQKMFDSLLIKRVDELRNEPYIVIEGESRKIGDIFIPDRLLIKMNNSPQILIEMPMEKRIEIILNEYTDNIDNNQVKEIVESLATRIGKKNVGTLANLLLDGKLYEFTEMLLEKYYDPLYTYGIKRFNFMAKIENQELDQAAKEVVKAIEDRLNIKS